MENTKALAGGNKRDMIRTAVFAVIIFAMELFFFRTLLTSGNMIGDRGDARLNNLIMEHWYKVFCGKERASDLPMFYPVQNTISYTDMLLGVSIPYSFFRLLGINMFKACKLTLIGVHFTGSYTLYFLLNKIYKANDLACLAAVTAFSFSNAYAYRSGHTQMMAVSLLPLLILIASLVIKHFYSDKRRRILMALFLTAYALLAYTGWYTFYFSAIFCIIFALFLIITDLLCGRKLLGMIVKGVRNPQCIAELLCYIIYFFVLLIPFLMSYIPTSRMSAGRLWEEIMLCSPQLRDMINLGSGNLLLGGFNDKIIGKYRLKGEQEMNIGFSPVLIIVFAVLVFRFIAGFIRSRKKNKDTALKSIVLLAFTFSVLFSLILVIEVSGHSIWYFIWKFVPGASSLRAVSRWYWFLTLPISIILTLLMKKPSKGFSRSYCVKSAIFIVLLWISNINTEAMQSWNYGMDREMISKIVPPEEAEVIAFYDSSNRVYDSSLENICYSLDAWMIAEHYGLKTVNGYSGQFPPGWNLYAVNDKDYIEHLREWRYYSGMEENIYIYDVDQEVWFPLYNKLNKN